MRPAVFNALVSERIMTGSAEVHEMGSAMGWRAEVMPLLCAIFILGSRGGEGRGGGFDLGWAKWKINGVISCWKEKWVLIQRETVEGGGGPPS